MNVPIDVWVDLLLLPAGAGLGVRDKAVAIDVAFIVVELTIDPGRLVEVIDLAIYVDRTVFFPCTKRAKTFGKFLGFLRKSLKL